MRVFALAASLAAVGFIGAACGGDDAGSNTGGMDMGGASNAMHGATFRVARLAGIDIEIHFSWLIIVVLVAWTLADGVFPDHYDGWSTAAYWVVGVVSAVLLFVTVLIHELAHALVAIRRGVPVPRITLVIFGGVSQLARQPETARAEFAIAAAGPASSLMIAAVSGAL